MPLDALIGESLQGDGVAGGQLRRGDLGRGEEGEVLPGSFFQAGFPAEDAAFLVEFDGERMG